MGGGGHRPPVAAPGTMSAMWNCVGLHIHVCTFTHDALKNQLSTVFLPGLFW